VVRTRIELVVDGDVRAPELGAEWRPLHDEPVTWQTSSTGLKFTIGEYER
jgi:hypothetical protein